MTILFLDYDGVLHPDATDLIRRKPFLRGDGELFMWAELLVAALADHPEVEIVLSTRWVRVLGYGRARHYLPEPLRQRVVGGTYHTGMQWTDVGKWLAYYIYSNHTWWDSATRYQQIKRWALRANIDDWIAIDGDVDSWPKAERRHLIQTDPATGLAGSNVIDRLQALLSEQERRNA